MKAEKAKKLKTYLDEPSAARILVARNPEERNLVVDILVVDRSRVAVLPSGRLTVSGAVGWMSETQV